MLIYKQDGLSKVIDDNSKLKAVLENDGWALEEPKEVVKKTKKAKKDDNSK